MRRLFCVTSLTSAGEIRLAMVLSWSILAVLTVGGPLPASPDGPAEAIGPEETDERTVPDETDEHEQTIRRARERLEKDPTSYESRFNLARALAFSGNYEQSIKQYTRLLNEYPDDPDAILGRGRVYAWGEQYEKAEADLQRVTSSHPEYAEAWRALGDLYFWWDRPEDALEAYGKWRELEPDNHEVYLSIAKVHRKRGRTENARDMLERSEQAGASASEISDLRTSLEEAEQEYPWELRQTYEHTFFASRFADWRVLRTELFREFDRWTVGAVVERQDRFQEIDTRAGFDVYRDLWSSSYANVRYLYSFDADVTPEHDVLTRLYQDIGRKSVLIPGYRHMDFTSDSVNIYSLGLGKYLGPFYGEVEAQLSPDDRGDSHTYLASLRYTWSEGEFVEVSGAYGDKTVTLSNNRVLRNRSSWSLSIRGETLLTEHYGTFGGFQYFDEEDVPIRRMVHVGLFYRW